MFFQWPIVTMLLVVVVFGILIWACRRSLIRIGKPSYAELVEQKNQLHESVIDWRYPDGSFVPQHKRQQMFRDLSRLSRKIRHHPDNPDNQCQLEESPADSSNES